MTVTFLFADVENSAALWKANPARMGEVLDRYDRTLRDAVEANRGHVFKTVGDACYAAFTRPEEALRASLEAQRALFTEEWSVSARLRARMALHTDAAEECDGDYSGASVDRVARLLSVGHGGQILLSGATYDLVGDNPGLVDERARFDDLGEHHPKDLALPGRIFQLSVPDLPDKFPPVPTRETPSDRYRIIKPLGRGGMANVYLARDEDLGRDVALKVMHSVYADDEEFVELFRKEAEYAASLSHPNIVSIYDHGKTRDGNHYIAMEHVPGGTLKDLLQREGPLPPRRSTTIAIQIAMALGYAHEHGMIHRDVKPDNVLLTGSGDVVVKVAGFGMGSAPYMSPEQVMERRVDPRSDLYSLGIMLYEMLTGTLPYDEEDPMVTAMQHVHGQLLPPKKINPNVPGPINDLTVRLLAKNPEERYPDIAGLVNDLKAVLLRPPADDETVIVERPLSGGGSENSPGPTEQEPAARFRGCVWLCLGLLTACVVIGFAAIGIAQQQESARMKEKERKEVAENERKEVAENERKEAAENERKAVAEKKKEEGRRKREAPVSGTCSSGDRSCNGNDGDDTIDGDDGANAINGKGGADTLNGYDGDDMINGHDGDDTLNGYGGNDRINGHEGNDLISGGYGVDTINGHQGDDTIDISGDGTTDTVNCHDGTDTVMADQIDNVNSDCENVTRV